MAKTPTGLPEMSVSDAENSFPPLQAASKPDPAPADKVRRAGVSDFWALVGCNLVVFGSSVCIMVLELTASRLIAGHLGQSLYSWTSVIGVVLAGLSAGNFLGGWLADRYPPQRVLAWLFLVAGLLTLSVLFVNQWAGGAVPAGWFSWPVWVMLVVAWIFLLPSIALGTISPVTASIALRRSLKTGATVGNIYAWGAIGSIVGTFLAGFVLIDLFGTRAIIVFTASALLLMSLLVGAGQWALRSGIFFGGLPLLAVVGLCAAATGDRTAATVVALRGAAGVPDAPNPAIVMESWRNWGQRLGRNLHDLGLTLRLRNDPPNEYHDESNYSQIAVGPYTDTESGERYQVLVLDALHHSYFDPDDPIRLNYDYERVYAAITERTCNRWDRTVSVPLRQLPVDQAFAQMLPERVRYDPTSRRLEVRGGLSLKQVRELLELGPPGPFRAAVLQAFFDSRAKQGQPSSTPLESLPEGVEFPADLADRVRYDSFLKQIQCDKPLSLSDVLQLTARGEQQEYVRDVFALFARSREVRTFFVGGGGFIFPRWIEAFFPIEFGDRLRRGGKPFGIETATSFADASIHVAEIDPAVVQAVQSAMGLATDGRATRIRAHVGDARKVLDDALRSSAALRAAGQPGVQFDFIYGDAFNHYSVPWHLTTEEFDRKVRDLLHPREGVYLVNVIDIFPRVEYPLRTERADHGSAVCLGDLPLPVIPQGFQQDNRWRESPPPHEKLQVRWRDDSVVELYFGERMRDSDREALCDLTEDDQGDTNDEMVEFRDAVHRLYAATHERRCWDKPLPAPLAQGLKRDAWTVAPDPYQRLEIEQLDTQRHVFGFRGRMTESYRAQLKSLAPADDEFAAAIDHLYAESHRSRTGRFLGRYVNTVRKVFPNVYVFSSNPTGAFDDRDTFVVACTLQKLDAADLHAAGGYWSNGPFAWTETDPQGRLQDFGQMDAVLDFADGLLLTDDYAPVDNLLAPLFEKGD